MTELLPLGERLALEADALPFSTHSFNSSSSSIDSAGSPHQYHQQVEHGMRLLLAPATAAAGLSSGGNSSSDSALAAASIPQAAAGVETRQLHFAGVIQLIAFCVFEVLIGMFWPSMMTLRAKYVPEQQRSTIINVFRIPLNLFVCLILWKVRGRPWVATM
jgi:hypothetical protein